MCYIFTPKASCFLVPLFTRPRPHSSLATGWRFKLYSFPCKLGIEAWGLSPQHCSLSTFGADTMTLALFSFWTPGGSGQTCWQSVSVLCRMRVLGGWYALEQACVEGKQWLRERAPCWYDWEAAQARVFIWTAAEHVLASHHLACRAEPLIRTWFQYSLWNPVWSVSQASLSLSPCLSLLSLQHPSGLSGLLHNVKLMIKQRPEGQLLRQDSNKLHMCVVSTHACTYVISNYSQYQLSRNSKQGKKQGLGLVAAGCRPVHPSVTVPIWRAHHCLSPSFPPTPMLFFPAFPAPMSAVLLGYRLSSFYSLQDLVAARWPLAELNDKSHAPRWKWGHAGVTAVSENKPAT